MEGYKVLEFLRKHIVLIVGLPLLLFVVVFLSGRGSLYIDVKSGTSGQELTYNILNQSNGKSNEVKTTKSSISKSVKKSNYEILVTQGEKSAWTTVKSGGFFKKTRLSVELKPEKNRQFVGYNPSYCMNYIGQVLTSYTCDDSFSNIKIHVPATANQATYTMNVSTNVQGNVRGIINTQLGPVALVRFFLADSDASAYAAYVLGAGLLPAQTATLSGLNPDKVYDIQPYKNGFLAYSDDFSDVKYYASLTTSPESVSIEKPGNTNIKPYLLRTMGDSVVLASSDKAEFEARSDPKAIGKVNSVIAVHKDGKTKQFSFNRQFVSAEACGNNKLCLLNTANNDKMQLFVYDIGDDTPKQLFVLNNITSIQNTDVGLLALSDTRILNLDVDNKTGFVEYSFGDRKFCGLQKDVGGYLLCQTNTKGVNAVLRIDQTSNNSDSIDKKVAGLEKMSEVKNVSVYGQFLFISPDLGELVYDNSLGFFNYDPSVKQSVNDKISHQIDVLGVDRNTYHIINTSQ